MARTPDQISQAIRTHLRLIDPDISVEPLTPERKIIDTVSEVISDSQVDNYILNYQFDIDTKVGTDLDRFVALFGFARQQGRRATGVITFAISTPATSDLIITAGSQVLKPATSVSPAVIFRTVVSDVIYVGTTTVDIPIEAVEIGPSGNVPSNTITALVDANLQVGSINNALATSGGSTVETDGELRLRFKNTVFRNIVGTQDQYLALAISSKFANKARIIGPISRFIEYVQIANNTPGIGVTGAISVIPYSKYTYNFDYYLTDGNQVTETFYTPRGVQYTFANTIPPSVTIVDTTTLPLNTIVLLEHSYCSANSRNDPTNNVMNYVDIYVSGEDVASVSESALFPGSPNNFTATTSSAFYTGNFKRSPSGATPTVGNRLQELLWQPVQGLPTTITIAGNTYTLNTHYWLVKDTSLYKGSRRSRDGIEWASGTAGAITTGTSMTVTYDFNRLPVTINEVVEDHKQVTSDVLVHAANKRYFTVNLVVMYTPGFSSVAVTQAIGTALTDYLERQQFGTIIQLSDIIEIVHDVPGVDNVRITTSTDNATFYGVQEVAADGTTAIGSPKITDFSLSDADLPVFNAVNITPRSQNTWN
jgi:uncharacterized phage protein gp47/JayE